MTKTSKKSDDSWESSLQASCEYLSAEDADQLRAFLTKHTNDIRPVYPFFDQKDSNLCGWQLLLTSQDELLDETNIPILDIDSFVKKAQVRLLFPFLLYKKPYSLPKGHWIRIGQIFTGYGRNGYERGDLIMNTDDSEIAYCEEITPSEWLDEFFKIGKGPNSVDLRNILPCGQLGKEVRFIPLTNDINLFFSLYEQQDSIGAIDEPPPVPSRNTDTPLTKLLHRIGLFFSTLNEYAVFFSLGVALMGVLLFIFALFSTMIGYGDSKPSEWEKGLVLAVLILFPLVTVQLWKRYYRLPLETPQSRKKKRDKLYDLLIKRELTRQYLESKTVAVTELKERENFWKILSVYDTLIHKLILIDEQKAAEILRQGRCQGGKRPEVYLTMRRSLEQVVDMSVTKSLDPDTLQFIHDMLKVLKED